MSQTEQFRDADEEPSHIHIQRPGRTNDASTPYGGVIEADGEDERGGAAEADADAQIEAGS